ncbi:unnamed protein product [Medioppia subpectinata]|uniref:Lysozyme n=1 Tax=Medioppia subpectinata TaxID=1979941 RepID=A0A7R9KVP1_9ACAR|nr:unnamed protein product [Medioppia subpectinata]CAG2110342.1 unnamed protein product [Medioppia subpectinata]
MCKQPAYNTCNTNKSDYVVCNTPKLPTEPIVCKKVTFANPDNKFCYGDKMCNTLANVYNTNLLEHKFTMDKQPSFNNNAYALANNSVWKQTTANPCYSDIYGKNLNMNTHSTVTYRTQNVLNVATKSPVTNFNINQDSYKANQATIKLIKKAEGCKYQIYDDLTGNVIKPGDKFKGKPTVCVGHMLDKDYEGIKLLEVVSPERCEQMLRKDLVRFEECVSRLVPPGTNSNQKGALVSFTFNLGCNTLKGSDLLKLMWAGDFAGAAKKFDKYVYAGPPDNKQIMAGLVTRRRLERELFETPSND